MRRDFGVDTHALNFEKLTNVVFGSANDLVVELWSQRLLRSNCISEALPNFHF